MYTFDIINRKKENIGTVKIDDQFISAVSSYKWSLANGYVSNRTQGYLHAFVWQLAGRPLPEPGFLIDHINFDRKDALLENLRIVSAVVSSRHQAKKAGSSSTYRGVSFNVSHQAWQAQIRVKDIGNVHLGYFPTELLAASQYKAAVKLVHIDDGYEVHEELSDVILTQSIQDRLLGKVEKQVPKNYHEQKGRFVACVRFEGVKHYIGMFGTATEAETAISQKLEALEAGRIALLKSKVVYFQETALIPWGQHELELQVDLSVVDALLGVKSQTWNRNGYPCFLDNKNTVTVHKWLINRTGQTVLPSQVIDHKDGDMFNASSSNLWVCTRSQNSLNINKARNNFNGVIKRGG